MDTLEDTIIALSSPWGRSSRAIIRLSGPEALTCLEDLFVADTPLSAIPTYYCIQGVLLLSQGVEVPAAIYLMRSPSSYTREDVVEIHTSGSPPLVEMLLEEMLQRARGLRLAQPGEFTRRAFLNGRIDLTQAEAVLRIIRSRSDAELRLALSQLEGGLSRTLKEIKGRLMDVLSLLEVSIDFSDQDIEPLSSEETLKGLETLRQRLSWYCQNPEVGKLKRGGVRVVLCGPPNAGKSSLLNALLGWPRAIASPWQGTTRDTLEVELVINGTTFCLVDTAGLDHAEGPGGLAVARTNRVVNSSELALFVLDGSMPSEQLHCLDTLESLMVSSRLLVVNKNDLPQRLSLDDLPASLRGLPTLFTSAITGQGIEEMKREMLGAVLGGRVGCAASPSILSSRQRLLICRTLESLARAHQALEQGMSEEFAALEVRGALDGMGELCGQATAEDILDRIFSQFCIGK